MSNRLSIMSLLSELKAKAGRMTVQSRASMAYLLSNVIIRSIGFITLPFFVRNMSTSEIGVVTTFSSWQSILYTILTLGVTTGSLSIAMHEYKQERNKYQSACLGMVSTSAFVSISIYLLFRDSINSITSLSNELFLVIFLLLLFHPAFEIWLIRQRFEYKYKSVIIISSLSSLLSAALSVLFVVLGKQAKTDSLAELRIFGQYLIPILIGCVFYFIIFKKGKVYYSKDLWSFSLRLSIPLVIHSLAKSLLDASDRIMIAAYAGESAAGIYGTMYSLCNIVLIIWVAINASLTPYIFEKLELMDYIRIERIGNVLLAGFGVLVAMATLILPDVVRLLTTSDYYEAMIVIPSIMAGIYISALYNLFGNYLLYVKRTNAIMISTLVAAGSNILLNIVFIPIWGYIAAAYTTFVSFAILAGVQGIMVRRNYRKTGIIQRRGITIVVVNSFAIIFCTLIIGTSIPRYITILVLGVLTGFAIPKVLKRL